jgi:hypothetical protein
MSKDDNGYPRYRLSTPELLRFVWNVHVHYKENLHPNLHYDYSEKQFIEHKTTEVSELFIVDLYNKMRELRIEI